SGLRTPDSGLSLKPEVWSLKPLSPFQFQPYIHEVVRRPRTRVLEGELVESARDRFHLGVERLLLIPGDQERRVHDHLVPDWFVDAGRDRYVPELVQHRRDISLRSGMQRRIDEAPVLHTRKIGRALLPGN